MFPIPPKLLLTKFHSAMTNFYLLEEGSKVHLPEHFKQLIESVHAERETFLKQDNTFVDIFSLENDYMACAFVTVALECGFRLERTSTVNFDIRVLRDLKKMLKWRDSSRHLYTIDFFLPTLQSYRFILLIVPIFQNVLVLNFLTLVHDVIIRNSVESLIPTHWLNLSEATIQARFVNMPLLARLTKRFIQKEKVITLNDENQLNPSLLGLPEELKRHIFMLLSSKDFIHLTSTCKAIHSFRKDKGVWKMFLKRDYNIDAEEPFDSYINKCATNKNPPSYPNFSDDLMFPIVMLHRTTSVSSLDGHGSNYQHLI